MVENRKIFQGWVSHSDWDDQTAEASLQVMSWSLKCEFETGAVELPFDGLLIQSGRGKKDTVFFSHPKHPDWTLSTSNRDILLEYPLQTNPNTRQQVLSIEGQLSDLKRLKATIYFIVGFFIVTFLAMNVSGWILTLVVDRIPVSYEMKIGDEVSKKLAKQLTFISAPEITNALKANLVQLLGQATVTKYHPNVLIYRSFEPNAFVIPGGSFYVSSELLSIAKTPEEVAGVMAHEAAHLKCHHILRQLIAEQGHGFLFKWIVGDHNNMLTTLCEGSDFLLSQTYSRECECQADEEGWEMLVAANIDPQGEINMLKKLDAFDSSSGEGLLESKIFRSHPLTQERIDRLQAKWDVCQKKSGFITLEKIEWKDTNAPEPLLFLQHRR